MREQVLLAGRLLAAGTGLTAAGIGSLADRMEWSLEGGLRVAAAAAAAERTNSPDPRMVVGPSGYQMGPSVAPSEGRVQAWVRWEERLDPIGFAVAAAVPLA